LYYRFYVTAIRRCREEGEDMKISLKIGALFIAAVVVAFTLFTLREASKPESAIIAAERDKLARSLDKDRAQKDQDYARDLHDKLQFLGYRLAVAYIAENKPNDAIVVLEKMIKDEEATSSVNRPRRSRSYFDEARYYEELIGAYELKGDDTDAIKAARLHDELQVRASELKRQEERDEGKSVGMNAP
jgi:predicted Zn-dependent protease